MTMPIETVATPSAAQLDYIEACTPRLVRQSAPGVYVVVSGPKPPPDPAWHSRQAELYRDAATREQSPSEADRLRVLAELHEGRAGG